MTLQKGSGFLRIKAQHNMGHQKHVGHRYFHSETAKFVSTLSTNVKKENANQPIQSSHSNIVVTSY
jgi:hypothetical protein